MMTLRIPFRLKPGIVRCGGGNHRSSINSSTDTQGHQYEFVYTDKLVQQLNFKENDDDSQQQSKDKK